MREKNTIANDLNQPGADFLKVELETGLTFANIALAEEPGSDKRARNQGHALKAFQTVLRLRDRFQIADEASTRHVQQKLNQLRSALETLGENLD